MILAFFGRYPGRAPNVFSCKIQHHVITFNCRQCHGKPGADRKENTVDSRDICKRAKILAQSMTIEDVVFRANYYEVATSRAEAGAGAGVWRKHILQATQRSAVSRDPDHQRSGSARRGPQGNPPWSCRNQPLLSFLNTPSAENKHFSHILG